MTRQSTSPHVLASQVLYAARLACRSPDQYESEVLGRLHRLTGLTDWERSQVRREVAFRLAAARTTR